MLNPDSRLFSGISVQLPDWIRAFLLSFSGPLQSGEDKMQLALALAGENIKRGGGPFGSVIFDRRTGDFVSAGVNLVLPLKLSAVHAEIVAISLAQGILGTHNLSEDGRELEIFITAEPCAMCMGAIPWSGIRSVVCSARDEDAREIGFDEGIKPADWIAGFRNSGIEVQTDVLRNEGRGVLLAYRLGGYPVY